jgi:hypothetical protein
MKKLLIALLAIGVIAFILPGSSANAAPYCGITWGSLPKTAASAGNVGTVTNVRTGQQDCYDRMVVDATQPGAGYDVRYVSNVYAEGSGQPISLTGGAKLQVIVRSPSYNAAGSPTYAGKVNQPLPGANLTGYQTFKSAKFAGSFEGQSAIGLGVRAQLPFRVMKLDNRVVIDVAHQW